LFPVTSGAGAAEQTVRFLMKTKIILVSCGLLLGVLSFWFGGIVKERELTNYLSYNSVINDSFRVSVYYEVLKKYDEGRKKEAIDTIRSWMETDVLIINAYKDQLSGTERQRVEGLLKAIEPYRKKSNSLLNPDAR
jgi:hypothetical protein